MDGLGQRHQPVLVQHQLLQLATPGQQKQQVFTTLLCLSSPSSLCLALVCLPAETLWDQLQVVVGRHELGQAGEFADARWQAVKVQFVGVHVQLLQLGQLTDG